MTNKESVIPNFPPHISRRSFIEISATTLIAGGLLSLGLTENNSSGNETTNRTIYEVVDDIQKKYGVAIPVFEGVYTKYQTCLGQNNELVRCGEEYNTEITLEEAEMIENSLNRVPSVGKYAQLIIPFRKDEPDAVGGGSFMGPNWDYFLDPSKYQNFPKDRYLSKFSAIELDISNKKLDETLPPVTKQSNFLPLRTEASMNEVGIKAINRVDYPWTTYGERLKQVVIHEIGGHGVKEYATAIKVNHDPKAENDASAMSMYGGIPLDTNNPIYSSFAKVNGWVKVPYSEFLTQWGKDGKDMSENLKINDPKRAAWKIWDRDPNVWGNLKDRSIRLDTYASYGTINETFATFFMFYTLSKTDKNYDRSLLTKAETKYFDRMFNGLSKNPEKYVKTLIEENPGPSYSSNLFEPIKD